MSQSFSAFVMCFCLLSVNLIILLSCYFLVFGSALVVLLPYSWFGRQVWVFNYFSLTSWNFMASPRLHHFRIALLLPMIYFFFILRLCVFQFFFSLLDTLVAFDSGCFECSCLSFALPTSWSARRLSTKSLSCMCTCTT